ncbi:MAG: hypothetical protein KC910_04765 [Candidatus Eremiobacteraeota bacterium]|nr:hypothetical protein [Candidatus Eremiobacteraeota bacterium]
MHLLADYDLVVLEAQDEGSARLLESLRGSAKPGLLQVRWEGDRPPGPGPVLCLGRQQEGEYFVHRALRLPFDDQLRDTARGWLGIPP